jgi:hypothetical protein
MVAMMTGVRDQKLDAIDFHHVPEAFRAVVRDWYAGRVEPLTLNGDRAVHLPHPAGGGRVLKLKGAGLKGEPVRIGHLHRSGPAAPVFDFDGRMMEDVASGHDGAPEGGCSFQQAATEYHVTQRLAAAGYPVLDCVGYGRIEKDGQASWFALFDLEPGLTVVTAYPEIPAELWLELTAEVGRAIVDLAVTQDLIGYCWYTLAPDGRRLLRDLHPFRQADPISMSQVSWAMQVFFALHMPSNTHRLRAPGWGDTGMPPDAHVEPFRAVCPDASLADHDALREQLVAPYMLKPPQGFHPERLIAILRENPITAALLDASPPGFARP